MISRFVVSLLLLPMLFFAVYINYYDYILLYTLVFIVSMISAFELSRLFRKAYGKYLRIFEYSTYTFNFLLIYVYFLVTLNSLNIFLPLIIPALAIVFAIVLLLFKKFGLKQIFLFIVSFVYTGVIPLIVIIIRYYTYGDILVYLLFLLVWVNDASALFIGSKLGKIKGIVKYSPNKSLEGYIGSFGVTLVVAFIFKAIFYNKLCLSYAEIIITAAILSITGHLGDILESAVKRKAGVKDSSKMFFDLGGMLDIFDSIIASAPFYFIILKLLCRRG